MINCKGKGEKVFRIRPKYQKIEGEDKVLTEIFKFIDVKISSCIAQNDEFLIFANEKGIEYVVKFEEELISEEKFIIIETELEKFKFSYFNNAIYLKNHTRYDKNKITPLSLTTIEKNFSDIAIIEMKNSFPIILVITAKEKKYFGFLENKILKIEAQIYEKVDYICELKKSLIQMLDKKGSCILIYQGKQEVVE